MEDYVSGMITDCADVDVDMFSYFEFLGYMKEFGYKSFSVVIYVRPPNCPGLICQPSGGDSNVTFEKESGQDLGGCEGLGTSEKASNAAENSANKSVPTTVTTDDSLNSSSESNSSESSSSTDNSSDSEHEELFEKREADYVSDTHEEYRAFRAEKRTVERRKKKESAHEQEHVKLGKKGPDVGIFKFQESIRKKLGLYVGRTVYRRARNIVLNEIMGDHKLEYGRILDYRDELLRSNPGSTCVVKVSDKTFEGGKKIGQLLVAVCKDGNNQMPPLVWAVVEIENMHTWRGLRML
nr:uncharacterized protein LOC104112214 [Nicotiana tomentosiformis]